MISRSLTFPQSDEDAHPLEFGPGDFCLSWVRLVRSSAVVMFDLRAAASWDERLTNREVEHRGKRVHVVGC